ncbi:putative AhpC/TSA family thioredoxin peroxidase [Hyaloscypha variabilis]
MASLPSHTAPRAFQSFRTAALQPRRLPRKPATPLFRRFLETSAGEQPRLRLGSTAPNFKAKTTHGDIDFHNFLGNKWGILFSRPADFAPVCTTELGAFAKLKDAFEKRGWIEDINDISNNSLKFPIITDADRKIAFLYDMLDAQDLENIHQKGIAFTIRSVFIIDPAKKIRLTMMYPASCGRNTSEVLRVIDSLQTADKKGITTPVNWQVGDDLIVPPTVSTADKSLEK